MTPKPTTTKLLAAALWLSFGVQILPVYAVAQNDGGWQQTFHRGSEALDAGEYWIAKPALEQAVVKAGAFGESDIRLAKSLDELGRYYTVRARFADAEPLLEEALYIKSQALGGQSDKFIPAMGSLIKFYLVYGTASKADPLTEQLLALVQGKMSEPIMQSHKRVKLKPGEALEAWAGVTDVEKLDPALEWSITLDDLGNLYRTRRNYDMAYRLYDASLNIKSSILGKQHLSLANSYDSLGSLFMEKGQPASAETYLKDSLSMTQGILYPESHEVYIRSEKLAKCLIKLGKYREAEAIYLKAQHDWDKEPSKYGDDARAALALGCLYANEKNFSAAAPVLLRALEISERYNGPDSINLVPYLKMYAYVKYYTGQKPQTENLRARSDAISGGT